MKLWVTRGFDYASQTVYVTDHQPYFDVCGRCQHSGFVYKKCKFCNGRGHRVTINLAISQFDLCYAGWIRKGGVELNPGECVNIEIKILP